MTPKNSGLAETLRLTGVLFFFNNSQTLLFAVVMKE